MRFVRDSMRAEESKMVNDQYKRGIHCCSYHQAIVPAYVIFNAGTCQRLEIRAEWMGCQDTCYGERQPIIG